MNLLKATLVFPYVYTSLNDVLNETDSFIKCRGKIHGNRKFKLNVDSYVLLDISKPVDCHYQYHEHIRANFTNILNFALQRINFFCVKNKWGAPLTKIFHCKKFCILLWYFFFYQKPMLFNKSSENLIIMLVLVLNCSPFSKDTVLFARLLKESNKEYRWTNLFLTMEMKWQIK